MTLPRTISRRNRQRPAPTQNPRAPAQNPRASAPPIAPYEEPLPGYDTAVRQGHGRGRNVQVGHAMQTRK